MSLYKCIGIKSSVGFFESYIQKALQKNMNMNSEKEQARTNTPVP